MKHLKARISNSHVNKNLEIKADRIIDLLQDVEGIHIHSLTEFTNYLNENNLGVFLLYRQVDIIGRAKFNEEVTLTTYPYNTTKASGYRHIYMYGENGDPLVKTNSFGAFVNLDTLRPVRLPEEIINSIGDKSQDPTIENLPRRIKYNDTNLKLIEKIPVRKAFIDRYNHLNNAHYVSFALNNMEYNSFTRIRAEYKDSFQLNDVIYVYEALDNENKTFVYKNDEGRIYTVIEFSNPTFK